jgi:hypothetical protein
MPPIHPGLFRAHLALPQDHGSWVFLLSPLLIGLFAGNRLAAGSGLLSIAVLLAFLIRQPSAIAVKALSGRRARTDLGHAFAWIAIYSLLMLFTLTGLVLLGVGYVLWLALPALPVFAWHLWLVSRRTERRQPGVEILASGVLALAAPAAYWIGRGGPEPIGWLLWLLTWLQSAASIVHVYLRLTQRELTSLPGLRTRLRLGSRALAYTGFNLAFSATLSAISVAPSLLFIPYLLQFGETAWGTLRPAPGAPPTRIGLRQLLISTLFTILFMFVWRLP